MTMHERHVNIEVDRTQLQGTLRIPSFAPPAGLVIFAHGSGSSRDSPRNIMVAEALGEYRAAGGASNAPHASGPFATYLFDLLDSYEANDRRHVFDIPLLARRMIAATFRMRSVDDVAHLPIGYFGASTGAAAALVAAAELAQNGGPKAVVSRGGRPDLAGPHLPHVAAPTLLLVGSLDHEVIELNREAQRQLRCENTLSIIPGATHLFEEPGTLEQVAHEAAEWFGRWLT